jgi:hypothetical protein
MSGTDLLWHSIESPLFSCPTAPLPTLSPTRGESVIVLGVSLLIAILRRPPARSQGRINREASAQRVSLSGTAESRLRAAIILTPNCR